MNRLLSKFRRAELDAEHEQLIRTALRKANAEYVDKRVPLKRGHKPGDPRKLRGIPVVGCPGGLGGEIPGTRPDRG